MSYIWETERLIASERVTLPSGLVVDLHVAADPDCPDFDCAEGDYTPEEAAAARRGDFTFVAVYLVPVLYGCPVEAAYSSSHEIPFGNVPGRESFATPQAEAEHLMATRLSLLLQFQAQDAPATGAELVKFGQYAHAYDDQLVRGALADPWVREHAAALAAVHRARGGRSAAVDDATCAGLSERGLASEHPPGCWYLTRTGAGVAEKLGS
jgi:hypothetical protein